MFNHILKEQLEPILTDVKTLTLKLLCFFVWGFFLKKSPLLIRHHPPTPLLNFFYFLSQNQCSLRQ